MTLHVYAPVRFWRDIFDRAWHLSPMTGIGHRGTPTDCPDCCVIACRVDTMRTECLTHHRTAYIGHPCHPFAS